LYLEIVDAVDGDVGLEHVLHDHERRLVDLVQPEEASDQRARIALEMLAARREKGQVSACAYRWSES
jgi:hypothetical protein